MTATANTAAVAATTVAVAATAVDKLVTTLNTKVTEGTGEAVAKAVKARKKSDLKVALVGTTSVIINTDEDQVLRVTSKEDAGYAAFTAYLKGKSSAFFPKTKLVGEADAFIIQETETLEPLTKHVKEEEALAIGAWATRFARQIIDKDTYGRNPVPAALHDLANWHSARSVLAKLVRNAGVDSLNLDVENLAVRVSEDGAKQLVFCNVITAGDLKVAEDVQEEEVAAAVEAYDLNTGEQLETAAEGAVEAVEEVVAEAEVTTEEAPSVEGEAAAEVQEEVAAEGEQEAVDTAE